MLALHMHISLCLIFLCAIVKAPQEATLDSGILQMTTQMMALKARSLRHDVGGFDTDDFLSKLIIYLGGGGRQDNGDSDDSDEEDQAVDTPLDWAKIGRNAMAHSRRVPVMEFMLGPLSLEHKKRETKRREKFDKEKEQERKPQEV